MENHNDKTSTEVVIRDEGGKFIKGKSGNPGGFIKGQKGRQTYAQRILYLSSQYTSEEIVEFAKNQKIMYKKFGFLDAMCIVNMARALESELTITQSGSDQVSRERKEILDRLEGTPVQTILNGAIEPPTPEELEDANNSDLDSSYDSLMNS